MYYNDLYGEGYFRSILGLVDWWEASFTLFLSEKNLLLRPEKSTKCCVIRFLV